MLHLRSLVGLFREDSTAHHILGGAATAVAGTRAWLVAALLPSVLTVLVVAVLGVVRRRASRAEPALPGVPHGPSMCAAALLGFCVEQ